jgi:hypothetical protein
MEWIIAVLLVVMGIGLIAAGTNGSANELFNSITGLGGSDPATNALSTAPGSSGSISQQIIAGAGVAPSTTSPVSNLGNVTGIAA